MVADALGRVAAVHADCALLPFIAVLNVQRFPRADLLVLANAIGVFAGVAHGRFVDFSGLGAADIDHDEPQRPANRGVRSPARAEHAGGAIDIELVANRAVDNKQGRGGMRRALHPVQVRPLITHGPHPGDHHRQIGRLAARHDGVDGDLLNRGVGVVGRHRSNHLIGGPSGGGQHGLHPLFGWRDHRQAVGHALLKVKLDQIGLILKLVCVLCHGHASLAAYQPILIVL